MSFGFLRKSCSDAVITVFARSALVSRSRNWAMDFALETSSTDFFWRSPYVDVLAPEFAAMNGAVAALLPASAASGVPSHLM